MPFDRLVREVKVRSRLLLFFGLRPSLPGSISACRFDTWLKHTIARTSVGRCVLLWDLAVISEDGCPSPFYQITAGRPLLWSSSVDATALRARARATQDGSLLVELAAIIQVLPV